MLTSDEIETLLDGDDEARLIGQSENEHLDFKEQPYLLGNDKGKWELAKDVAALANSGGGCLVVGVATTVPEDREDEVASETKPFPATLADVKQHRDAIDAAKGVYPVLRSVQIRKFTRAEGKALMLIRVPEQSEDDLPFMVVRMVEGDEKRGIGVGVPFRSGAHTYWEPPGQLHRDLSDGRRARRRTEALVEPPVPKVRPSVPVESFTDKRLIEIEQFMGWTDAPTLLLAAIPETQQRVPVDGFYDRNRIRGCVESPPELRHAGFGLARRSEPTNVEGSLVNATAESQVLWVDPDGKCFAASTGQQSFLTRSGGVRTAVKPEPRSVNPTVVVEWTYLFFAFVQECVSASVAGGFRIAARLRGARSRPWSLRLLAGAAHDIWGDGQAAGLDDWYFETDGTLDPASDAFRVLAAFYSLFGFPADRIPYTSDGRVDPEQIRALR